jgi:hypothetical protein
VAKAIDETDETLIHEIEETSRLIDKTVETDEILIDETNKTLNYRNPKP